MPIGSYVSSTEQYFKISLAKYWAALNAINNIWKSNLSNHLKIILFRDTVESVSVYGATTWTLTTYLEKSLDGNYTRMLRVALNKSWRDHPTIKDLYGNTPRLSTTIRRQRLRLAATVGALKMKW